jgi:hypothetical protein
MQVRKIGEIFGELEVLKWQSLFKPCVTHIHYPHCQSTALPQSTALSRAGYQRGFRLIGLRGFGRMILGLDFTTPGQCAQVRRAISCSASNRRVATSTSSSNAGNNGFRIKCVAAG